MPPRPTWKGYLKLSLVSVPVKAFTLADHSHNGIKLNQLHATCHRRIRYAKTCPEHGEVPSDEIISGYQIGEDQYVPIDNATRPSHHSNLSAHCSARVVRLRFHNQRR